MHFSTLTSNGSLPTHSGTATPIQTICKWTSPINKFGWNFTGKFLLQLVFIRDADYYQEPGNRCILIENGQSWMILMYSFHQIRVDF